MCIPPWQDWPGVFGEVSGPPCLPGTTTRLGGQGEDRQGPPAARGPCQPRCWPPSNQSCWGRTTLSASRLPGTSAGAPLTPSSPPARSWSAAEVCGGSWMEQGLVCPAAGLETNPKTVPKKKQGSCGSRRRREFKYGPDSEQRCWPSFPPRRGAHQRARKLAHPRQRQN